jgi:hypothetical protein
MHESYIAYDEDVVRKMYCRNGLEIVQPIEYGNWSVKTSPPIGQDRVIAIKGK